MNDTFDLTVDDLGVAHVGGITAINPDDAMWVRDLDRRDADIDMIDADQGVDTELDGEFFSPVFDPHHTAVLMHSDCWDLHGPERDESSGRKPRTRK